jgi:prohibitin 2
MSGPNSDQFRRFAQAVQRQASSGGGRGLFAGGGLLIALAGGGVLLTSSLFNGESARYG